MRGGGVIGRRVERVSAGARRWSETLWAGAAEAGPVADAAHAALRVCMPLAVLAAVVQGVVHLVNVLGFDGRSGMLNADADQGVFTWASASSTFAAGLGAAMLAALVRERRMHLLLLAVLLAGFSLDDAVAFHERISVGAIGPIEHGGRILWPAVTMPLLALVFVLMACVGAAAPRALRRALGASLVMLVLAVGLEVGSSLLFEVGSDHGEPLYESEVAVEEGLELAAWMLAAGALAAGVILVAAGRGGPPVTPARATRAS